MKTVLLIGDSIRLHYQPYVIKAFEGQANVWGPEENCQSSGVIWNNLDRWVISKRPDVVHLNCGLHDLRHDEGPAEALVPLDAYQANITGIFERVRAETTAELIWATVTPIIEERHQAVRSSRRYERDVSAYNAVGISVARRFGVTINDLHTTVSEAGPEVLLKQDGLHFVEEGYALLGAKVADALRSFVIKG
ncbi:SGNH/GDSL hydrolase family protein [Rhizobium leguminosarum]|nr:SGNH/GDSL hydrolase family protein [Rhizobium leguminosarum]MBY5913788.1 SGNH/GDSL hydrolase family protein [Rhizobium leguminosarum]RWX21514.1 SGNH/GDSL hydrolase family protein [Rhizobium leguminosarum]TBE56695.1 SGNH/GDSL hydrolase family protein [Rhizobium leguminosarum]TBZ53644.1 SGNH/GDSL hydrolase family protein [Rhizobium leguminosarum bv. viciae]TBZ86916.1 SGNH/GDSL hydrolase family protein [Rhizobium leguminosarum bv. viciae]